MALNASQIEAIYQRDVKRAEETYRALLDAAKRQKYHALAAINEAQAGQKGEG